MQIDNQKLPKGLRGSQILCAFRDAATYQPLGDFRWVAEKFDSVFLEIGIRVTPAIWYKPGRIACHIGRRAKWVTKKLSGSEISNLSQKKSISHVRWNQLCFPHFKTQITLLPVLVDATYFEVSVQAYMINDSRTMFDDRREFYIHPFDVPASVHLRPDYDKIIERFLENCGQVE